MATWALFSSTEGSSAGRLSKVKMRPFGRIRPDAMLMDELDGNGKIIQLGEVGRASAVKMVYASVTKGTVCC